jgi:hypothetical protein
VGTNYTLEKTGWAIQDGQSREVENTEHTSYLNYMPVHYILTISVHDEMLFQKHGININKRHKQNNQNLLRLSMPNNAKGAAHFGSM